MNLNELRENLRPLTSNEVDTVEERDYFQFYGIDFEGEIEGVRHEFGSIDSQNYTIAAHRFLAKKATGTVFIVHGLFDHVGLFTHIIRYFLVHNYNVVAFDLPGHGLSSGERALINSFDEYRLVLADVLAQCHDLTRPWIGFGQSTGSSIIVDTLLEQTIEHEPHSFDRIILSAPLVRPYQWISKRFQFYLMRPFINSRARQFTNNSRDEAWLAFAHNDPLAPRVITTKWLNAMDKWINKIERNSYRIRMSPYIIQGRDDQTVDADYNIEVLRDLFNDSDVLWLEGARHHLPNEIEKTRNYYMNWLSNRLFFK